ATRTPRATNAIWPMYTPPRLLRTTSSSPQPGLPGTHPGDAPPVSTAEQTNSPKAMVEATPASSSHAVLGTERSFDHSARRVRTTRPPSGITPPKRPPPPRGDPEPHPWAERRVAEPFPRDLDREPRRRSDRLEERADRSGEEARDDGRDQDEPHHDRRR